MTHSHLAWDAFRNAPNAFIVVYRLRDTHNGSDIVSEPWGAHACLETPLACFREWTDTGCACSKGVRTVSRSA